MTPMPKTFIGIDPGINFGWGVISDGKRTYGSGKFDSLAGFENTIRSMVVGLKGKPVVLVCRAMGRNQQVIRKHSAISAMVELVCEKNDIEYYEVADRSIRKVVMGKGNAKKLEVMAFLGIDNEHAADALLGAMYIEKLIPREDQ